MITWNKDAPLYNNDLKDDDYLANNAKCIDFIDKYVCIDRPHLNILDEDEYEHREHFRLGLRSMPIKFQTHVHKKNCNILDEFKKEVCKYGFPWPLLEKTIILEPLDCEKNAKCAEKKKYYNLRKELERIDLLWRTEKKETSLEDLLKNISYTYDDYIYTLRSSIKRSTVFLKRTCKDLMINPYNKQIYMRHRANMDIQFVTDPYGAAAYVTAYMLKSNASMSQILKLAIEEVMTNDNMTVRQRLVHIANKFNNCSEVSAQECTFTLLSMPVSRLSRSSCYINTYPLEERNLILKENRWLETLDPKSKKIFRIGLMEHYVNRPSEMKTMCLAEFAAFYDYVSKSQLEKLFNKDALSKFPEDDDDLDDDINEVNFGDDDDEDESVANNPQQTNESENVTQDSENLNSNDEEQLSQVANRRKKIDPSKYIKLNNKDGYIKKRTKAKVLRYKRYNNIDDPQNYFRVQIMLYVPWFDEKKDVEGIEDYFDYFISKNEVICENRAKICTSTYGHENQFDRAQEQVEEEIGAFYDRLFSEETTETEDADVRRNDLVDRLNQANEDLLYNLNQNRHEEYEMDFGYHAQMYDDGISGVRTIQLDENEGSVINLPKLMTDNEYSNLMMSLNREQHKYSTNLMAKMRDEKQFFDIVTGGAGTGKSHLIKACYQTFMRHVFKKMKKNRDTEIKQPYAILGAFTGKAAFNIRGSTLHSLFHLQTKSAEYKDMNKDLCSKVKRHYEHLKLIIIDEVSMVSKTMFEKINLRMKQIMVSNEPFGGMSVILVGDFNQLRPVAGSWIFEKGGTHDLYTALQTNQSPVWNLFRLFHLTEIMRQRGDVAFAQALNILGKYGSLGLTDEQVRMFNQRIVEDSDVSKFPRDALILNYEIEKCKEFNNLKIECITDQPLIENMAVDLAAGEEKKTQAAQNFASTIKYKKDFVDTIGLPNLIRFKVGCKYMITSNIRVDDGLVNGCVGTLKHMLLTNSYNSEEVRRIKPLVKRIYMDFSYDDSIGQKTRNKENKTHRHKDNVDLNCLYTILECTRKKIPKTKAKYHAERLQYSLVECESMTIHKSQGQTYESVVVNIGSNNLSRALIYVALSRVTSINGLTLIGARSILPPGYENKTFEQRKEECAKRYALNNVEKEMSRLRRKAPFENVFTFLDLDPIIGSSTNGTREKELNMLCLNIQSLNSNRAKLIKDFGILNADLIFLVECHNNVIYHTQAAILLDETHKLVYFSSYYNSSEVNPSNGQVCYERKRGNNGPNRIRFIANNCDHNEYMYKKKKDCVELSLFAYNHSRNDAATVYKPVYIVCVYKHPDMSNRDFVRELLEFVERHVPNAIDMTSYMTPSQSQSTSKTSQEQQNKQPSSNLVIVGDFNLDFNKKVQRMGHFKSFGFEPLFIDVPTHNAGNQLDWAFKNSKFEYEISGDVYETWFSDHSAIWTRIKF